LLGSPTAVPGLIVCVHSFGNSLAFDHPATGRRIFVTSPLPSRLRVPAAAGIRGGGSPGSTGRRAEPLPRLPRPIISAS